MQELADRFPDEPAVQANLGVFAMRQGDMQEAEERLSRARELAPKNADIEFLSGLLQSRNGNVEAALGHLREAARLDSTDARILYALAGELERENVESSTDEVFSLYEQIRELHPGNAAILLETIRISLKWDRDEPLQEAFAMLEELSQEWPSEVKEQFTESRQAVEQGQGNSSFQLAFLRNSLNTLPQYQNDLAQIQLPPNQVGFLIDRFLWLPEATVSVAPRDDELTFEEMELAPELRADFVVPAQFSDTLISDWVALAGNKAVIKGRGELPFPGKAASVYASATLDYNYDFFNDIAFAGSGGFRLYAQQQDSSFTDVTSSMGLPVRITAASYFGTWSRDIDLDGDLDILLSATDGSTTLLRNNGDGTFRPMDTFGSVRNVRNFEWADMDGDGDPEAAFLTGDNTVRLLVNERSGNFEEAAPLSEFENAIDIETADINSDGLIDLLVWNTSGIHRVSWNSATGGWASELLLEDPKEAGEDAHLFSFDLDNNGGNDLITTGKDGFQVNLSTENLEFGGAASYVHTWGSTHGFADLDGDMRLDFVGISEEGVPEGSINSGSKGYNARIIRPRASGTTGDQRINSFGIGGEIEIRSGLLYQKQLIKQPWVHLGLGTYEEAEMLRILWPNGSVQAEFAELGYGSRIFNEQILKGSCPWLFAWNGEEMEFVTDFIWRSPLGLRINAQATAGVVQTEDRVKVSGDLLKEKDGYYELRITADLWETHFFDHVSLMAVDHPEGTEIFVDERFAIPSPDLSVRPTAKPRKVASVIDSKGNEVGDVIDEIDGRYLDHFEKTKYQGVAQSHYIEIKLGDGVPAEGQLWLLAHGWVRPTDSSINYALSQGANEGPKGLSVEIPDGKGGWKEVHSNLGFPAGKSKTVMIDLQGLFGEEDDKRLRLHTTTETYWDAIRWAEGLPETEVERKVLDAETMDLRYRGFSKIVRENVSSPELPDYQTIAGTTQRWLDLEGYYTRFGDVSELLQKVDDRYVIMNAGDEMVFKFRAPEAPKEGWVRDFVLIGDGWVKDGDYNTLYSRTVLPLPSHNYDAYKQPGQDPMLTEDPIYQKHKEDWVRYHTRYITPRPFNNALTNNR